MNLNELLHVEQVHLMRREAAKNAGEIAMHGRELESVAHRLAALHYNHRPYARPAGSA